MDWMSRFVHSHWQQKRHRSFVTIWVVTHAKQHSGVPAIDIMNLLHKYIYLTSAYAINTRTTSAMQFKLDVDAFHSWRKVRTCISSRKTQLSVSGETSCCRTRKITRKNNQQQ